MKTAEHLSTPERKILDELRARMRQEFPHWNVRMTLFGSRARGDAEPDSDMDVLLDIQTEQVSFAEKQNVRRLAGEISIATGIIVSLLIVDQRLKRERGDFSIFQNILDEGLPL